MVFFKVSLSLMFAIFLLLMVAFLVLVERKYLGLDQIRKSPNITSWYSMIQTISDSVKLILKKYMLVGSARVFFYIFSPVLGFFLPLVSWFFLVVGLGMTSSEVSILGILFIGSILVYCIVWASWSSNNTYGLISAIRAVAQMISYEIVMGFFLIMIIFKFDTFSWGGYMMVNLSISKLWTFLLMVFVLVGIILAETNRTPFDLVESESELVGGYNVEFSSGGFTLLFLSEYTSIWLMGTLTCVVLGLFLDSFLLLILYMVVVVVFFIHLRAQLPRVKFVDLIYLMWVVLLPVVTIFGVGFLYC